jgi:hypothetical protein
MRFRTGVLVGAVIGYYFGAKAGRERYEQLRKVVEKGGALVALGRERLRPREPAEVIDFPSVANN